MNTNGCELQTTVDGRGDGVFATRRFRPGETVLVGVIACRVDANHSHATQVGASEWVELADLGSKVNHSCDPNCGIRVNARGAPDLVARRPIAAGEEVTFDYAMRNYSIEHFAARCRCGAPLCRETVTGWKDLPDERKQAYRGQLSPYLLDLDHQLCASAAMAEPAGQPPRRTAS